MEIIPSQKLLMLMQRGAKLTLYSVQIDLVERRAHRLIQFDELENRHNSICHNMQHKWIGRNSYERTGFDLASGVGWLVGFAANQSAAEWNKCIQVDTHTHMLR